MFDLPPQILLQETSVVQESPAVVQDYLVIPVMRVDYDANAAQITMVLGRAYETQAALKTYVGEHVALIEDRKTGVNPADCPIMPATSASVHRDSDLFFQNTMTVRIMDVTFALAGKMEVVECLRLDTKVLRAVIGD